MKRGKRRKEKDLIIHKSFLMYQMNYASSPFIKWIQNLYGKAWGTSTPWISSSNQQIIYVWSISWSAQVDKTRNIWI